MAFVIADRVQETTDTAGTGPFNLTGASAGYRSFSSQMAVGDNTRYCAVDPQTGAWETGTGSLSGATTLTRFAEASSNANALVNFAGSAGTVVFMAASAGYIKAVRDPQWVPIGFRMRGLPGSSTNDTTNNSVMSQESYMTPADTGVRGIRLGYAAYDQLGTGLVPRRNTATISASIYCPTLASFTVQAAAAAASAATALTLKGQGAGQIRLGDRITGTGIAANTYVSAITGYTHESTNFGYMAATVAVTVTPALTGAVSLNASITVAGAIHQATLNQTATSMTLLPGRGIAFFDPIQTYIPANTQFYVRTHATFSSAAISFADHASNAGGANLPGEAAARGTGIANQTLIPTTPTAANVGFWPPACILAKPDRAMPSVLIIGDSQTQGFSDIADASGRIGFIAKSLGNTVPWMHFGRPNNTAWAEGKEVMPYVDAATDINATHVIIGMGTNDVYGSSLSSADAMTAYRALAAPFIAAGMKVWALTLFPNTTGTFTTVAGQTVANATANTQRLAFNAELRSNFKAYGFERLADVDLVGRDATDTSKWAAGYTTDGLHPGPNGVTAIVNAGLFAPSLFGV